MPIGPIEATTIGFPYFSILEVNVCPSIVNLFEVGLNPYTPQYKAGIRIDPAISEPIAKGEHLAATSPASPPELPPTVLSLFQGFLALPHILFTLSLIKSAYGTFPLINGIAPYLRNNSNAIPSLNSILFIL